MNGGGGRCARTSIPANASASSKGLMAMRIAVTGKQGQAVQSLIKSAAPRRASKSSQSGARKWTLPTPPAFAAAFSARASRCHRLGCRLYGRRQGRERARPRFCRQRGRCCGGCRSCRAARHARHPSFRPTMSFDGDKPSAYARRRITTGTDLRLRRSRSLRANRPWRRQTQIT